MITFLDHGAARLEALSEAIGFDDRSKTEALRLFSHLTSPWGTQPIGPSPCWGSDITDDATPFEFSVAFEDGRPELRVLLEAQPPTPDPVAAWASGEALSQRLERDLGACLDRLRSVEDLYVPTHPAARFAIWHATMLAAGKPPRFKIYLNPQARGPQSALETVAQTLRRLGVPGDQTATLERRGQLDEIKYLSLDISRRYGRIKVYVAHHRATTDDIERAAGAARGYVAGDATRFCRAMSSSDGPYTGRPVFTCLTFMQDVGCPVTSTIHFPIRSYVPHDGVARERIRFFIDPENRAPYERVVQAFRTRRLDHGAGMHTYASLRAGSRPRLTIYFSSEAYSSRRAG